MRAAPLGVSEAKRRHGAVLRVATLLEFRELRVQVRKSARELFSVTAVLRVFELFLHLRA